VGAGLGLRRVGSLGAQTVEVIYSNMDGNFSNEDDDANDNNNDDEHDVNKSKRS
jgi:hypothetical protein